MESPEHCLCTCEVVNRVQEEAALPAAHRLSLGIGLCPKSPENLVRYEQQIKRGEAGKHLGHPDVDLSSPSVTHE